MVQISKDKSCDSKIRSAYGYLRVSTQSQSNSGLGLAAQKDQIRKYAKQNGYRITKYYTDAGVSGTKSASDRPGMSQMLDDLSPTTTILVAKRCRISRDMFLALWVEKECKKVGCTIESCSGEGNGDDSNSQLLKHIINAFAEHERNQISDRTKQALAKTDKYLGLPEYGFSRDPETSKLVKDPATYPIRERIIKMRTDDDMGWTAISNVLNDEDIPTKLGKKWNPVQVMRICNRAEARRIKQAAIKNQKEEAVREI